MFIFQHISSFISLIHPLSAVFISEETECRTFVIENKSISFSIFNAMEMTSGEILDLIRKNSEAQSVYDNLRQILQLADFVKFAKMNPLPDENDLSMMNAYLFVNQTKEEEMVELVDSPLSDELTASGQEERQPAVKAVDSPLSNEPVAPCQDDLTRYQPKSTNDTTNLKD